MSFKFRNFSSEKRFVLIALGILIISLYFLFTDRHHVEHKRVQRNANHNSITRGKCGTISDTMDQIQKEDSQLKLDQEDNEKIFFFETSGKNQLLFRQSCAIESAARKHPEATVYVFFFNDTEKSSPFYQFATQHLQNIKFIHRSLESHFYGTVLQKWFHRQRWAASPHKMNHLSDAIRLINLWKYGGLYLDMDVVVMKSLNTLNNTAGMVSTSEVGNGVMKYQKHHPVLTYHALLLDELYDPEKWSFNGPAMLSAIYRRLCHRGDLQAIVDEGCSGFPSLSLTNKSAFYLVPFPEHKTFFSADQIHYWQEKLEKYSYLAHVWNKVTKVFPINGQTECLYATLAKMYCPYSFKTALESNGYF